MNLDPTLDPNLALWLLASLLAVVILARLMDRRRARLRQLLQAYVAAQAQWTQKRAKATRLSQAVARQKSDEAVASPHSLPQTQAARRPLESLSHPSAAELAESIPGG